MILCVDEKSQIQALGRTQTAAAHTVGANRGADASLCAHGTTSLFAALEVKTGEVLGQCQRRHRSVEIGRFLHHIETNVRLSPGEPLLPVLLLIRPDFTN